MASTADGRRGTARAAGAAFAAMAIAVAALAPAPARGAIPASGAPEHCPDLPLSVRGGDADDAADACAGGAAAIAFLAGLGLVATMPIDIEIVARMPDGTEPDAAGCFDPAAARVLLLDHAGLARSGSWMGRPIDRPMHRAIAAHEVAHAVAACHFAMPRPARIASEYVAYVAMFATMDPGLRTHALAVHPDAAWADDAPPTEAEYAASPMRFGARAWRHWQGLSDPAATLRAILEGRVLSGPGRGP